MNRLLLRYFALCCIAAPLTAVAAGDDVTPVTNLRVTDVEVLPLDDRLTVSMNIDSRQIRPGRDSEVTFTPVIQSLDSDRTISLPPFKVSGRNIYYIHMRNGDLDDGEMILRAGEAANTQYTATVPWAEWMEHARVEINEELSHCCDLPKPLASTPIAEIDRTRRTADIATGYVALTGDSAITRSAEGRAFITFVVNRTQLDPDYMNNPAELRKIYETVELAANDPDAIVTSVTFKGFASPEGSYSNNTRLAIGRTNTLRDHVRSKYNFSPDIMHSDYEPEDWQGLIDWLTENQIDHRDEILAIASSDMEPDARNNEIKRRYPVEYAYLLKNVYPWLRHSDYTVQYQFKTYNDIEELVRIYSVDPSKLRPVDFSRLADSYGQGSEKYDEVYLTAVEVWPDNMEANLNAANIKLKGGDIAAAEQYVRKAGNSAEAAFTRGAIAAKRGDLDLAITYMEQALELGLPQASGSLEMLKKLRSTKAVNYLLPAAVKTGK